ncbi:MAG: hypothetical protein AB7I25_14180 [Vicinamibacterales bacterium]
MQLALYEPLTPVAPMPPVPTRPMRVDRSGDHVCAGCRAREARYGFRDGRRREHSRTLCFECFRMELDRRHAVAERRAHGWDASQSALPLAQVLEDATRRRRRAQIAARHALGLR